MFETIAQSGTRKWRKGAIYALPATLLIYALVGTGLALYALFGPQDLRPPIPTALIFSSVIPIDIPAGGEEEPKEEKSPSQEPEPPQAPAAEAEEGAFVEPVDVIDTIPSPTRVPFKHGGRGGNGEAIDGGAPTEFAGSGIGPGIGPGVGKATPKVYNIGEIRPPKAVSRIEPKYPSHLEAMRLKATVHVEVVIDENGRVVKAFIAKSSNSLFDQAALEAARKWRFTRPISQPMGAVRVHHLITFRFK